MPNAYLTAYEKVLSEKSGSFSDYFSEDHYRDHLATEYAWAIPSDEAIQALVEAGPIVEIGAGTGYWASLVAKAGGTIVAYDAHPPQSGTNPYRHRRAWFDVREGGPEKVTSHPQHTLFLCWPPYKSPMAHAALSAYTGKRVVYVGEFWGCTGDDAFHDLLSDQFEEGRYVKLPQWRGIHDAMMIFERK